MNTPQQPLASIHPNAKIGANVVIEPFVTIEDDVEIGEGTWIGSHAVIYSGARIGKNCQIFPGAVISAIPQDKKFEGEQTTAILGDNVVVREYATVNRGTRFRGETIIGERALVMAYTHVAHDCVISHDVVLSNAVNMAGHVEIGPHAVIGGMSAIHQFSKIGAHSIVQARTYIRKDVPPYVKAGREPLAYAGINSVGLRRRGYSWEQVQEIQEIYRVVFLSGLNTSQALVHLQADHPASPERDEIMTFIQKSERGIIKKLSNLEFEFIFQR